MANNVHTELYERENYKYTVSYMYITLDSEKYLVNTVSSMYCSNITRVSNAAKSVQCTLWEMELSLSTFFLKWIFLKDSEVTRYLASKANVCHYGGPGA